MEFFYKNFLAVYLYYELIFIYFRKNIKIIHLATKLLSSGKVFNTLNVNYILLYVLQLKTSKRIFLYTNARLDIIYMCFLRFQQKNVILEILGGL